MPHPKIWGGLALAVGAWGTVGLPAVAAVPVTVGAATALGGAASVVTDHRDRDDRDNRDDRDDDGEDDRADRPHRHWRHHDDEDRDEDDRGRMKGMRRGKRMGPEVRYMPSAWAPGGNQYLVIGGGMQKGRETFSMGFAHNLAIQTFNGGTAGNWLAPYCGLVPRIGISP